MLFFCFTRYLRRPKRKYTKVIYSRRRYIYIFFYFYWSVRTHMHRVAREEVTGGGSDGGRTASRVPKASTFCYAIARSWRRHSIKRRTRHHGRPINPQTKVDYDFSRGHRSRLLLRVHCTNLNIEPAAASYYVLRLLSGVRFLFLFLFPLFFLF